MSDDQPVSDSEASSAAAVNVSENTRPGVVDVPDGGIASSALCTCLRTKTAFGSFIGDYRPWQEGGSSTAAYWCLRTMSSAGPDDRIAHPQQCRPGRVCFEEERD